MKIRVAGFVLSGLFLVFVAYFLSMGFTNVGIGYTVTNPVRLVSPDFITTLITALSEMLWHYRGINMVMIGLFLFVSGVATSVFFHENAKSKED